MHFLITGGAGFVGSHLAEYLLDAGHSVHVIDDLSTGRITNLGKAKEYPRFSYTIDTCENRAVLAELIDEADAVFHLAAAVGVRLIVESPVTAIETNIHLTEIVLELASKKGKPVLITSTSEVYGKGTAIPFREDGDLTFGPTAKGRWAYACSKAVDEFLAVAYWQERGLPTVIVRLFNTVGPRQTGRYGMVVPRLVRQALLGESVTVFGDGLQSRCFCHVTDAVRAITALLANDDAVGQVYNVGSTEEVSILGLAQRIIEFADSDSEIIMVPYDEAYNHEFEDMSRRVPSLSKVQSLTDWTPEYRLDDILKDVLADQSQELGMDISSRTVS